MNASIVISAVAFGVGVAFVAHLTYRQRGPFAFVLVRLRADRAAYLSVTTTLWAVVAGLLAFPLLAYAWPDDTMAWAPAGFVLLAALANAMRSMLSHRAA